MPAIGRFGDGFCPIQQPAPWTKPSGHGLSRIFDGGAERREAEMRRRAYVSEKINFS